MVDPVEPVQAVAGAVRMDNLRHIKLSDVWPQAPQLWFSQTECRFAAHGVADEFARYCLVVGVLPHDSLWRVADIVESPPQENPYTIIKQAAFGGALDDRLPAGREALFVPGYRQQEAVRDDGGHAGDVPKG
jgi:hypothetical protein